MYPVPLSSTRIPKATNAGTIIALVGLEAVFFVISPFSTTSGSNSQSGRNKELQLCLLKLAKVPKLSKPFSRKK